MNFVEIESPVRGSRHGKMPGMNRIERASKQRDTARMMFCGAAVRCACAVVNTPPKSL